MIKDMKGIVLYLMVIMIVSCSKKGIWVKIDGVSHTFNNENTVVIKRLDGIPTDVYMLNIAGRRRPNDSTLMLA